MPLTIADREITFAADGTPTPTRGASAHVVAQPTLVPLWVRTGATSEEDQSAVRTASVNPSDGTWSLVLPWPSVCTPNTVQWTIRRSDGATFSGTVPEGVSGPLGVWDLVNSYGWGVVASGATPAPVTAVQGPGIDATTAAVGGVLIDQAPASGHPIALTAPRRGAANGLCDLDATSLVPLARLPPPLRHDAASYVVYIDAADSNTIKARNAQTGAVDYSGTDAATVINAAIAACPGRGGRVVFAPGTYTISTPILVTRSQIALVGGGLRYVTEFQPQDSVDYSVSSAVTGLALSAGGTGYTVGTYSLTISGGGGSGATGTATVNSAGVVASVSLTAGGTGYTSAPAVSLSGAGAGSGFACLAGYSPQNATLVVGGSANVSSVFVDGISFTGRKQNHTSGHGVIINGSDCTIQNCRISQFVQDGLRWGSYDGSLVFDNIASNVYIIQCGNDGMLVEQPVNNSEFVLVKVEGGSTASALGGRYGLYSRGSALRYHQCHPYFMATSGMRIDAGQYVQVFSGEYETNSVYGIDINAVEQVTVDGVLCYGNGSKDIGVGSSQRARILNTTCYSTAADKHIFITGNGTQRCIVQGNTLKGAAFAGVSVESAAAYCLVQGNNIGGLSRAVSIDNATNNTIKANLCELGIVEQNGANNNRIVDNHLMFSTTLTLIGANSYARNNKTNSGTDPCSSVISSGAAQKGMVIQGASAQTASLQEWQDSTAAILAKIDANGYLTTNRILDPAATGPFFKFFGTVVQLLTRSATNIGFVIQGAASQSADLMQFQDSTAAVKAKVDASGAIAPQNGARLTSGSGAPTTPGGINPVAGDVYHRTDTPTVANQRIYVCSVGGASPTWVGIV